MYIFFCIAAANYYCLLLYKHPHIMSVCLSVVFSRLRQIDIETMKKLHHKVNIVPLIAKADILTKRELKAMKDRVSVHLEVYVIYVLCVT